MEDIYDVIIIGAGCTGYSAAMYSGRLGSKTLVIGETPGGTIILTDRVENYPGFIRLTGQELADKLKAHAMNYKDNIDFLDKTVLKITRDNQNECFKVTTSDKGIHHGRTIIYATGTKWRELHVPGHDEYKNKGVHYCALCDGFFYRGKTVAIVGGSDSAAKEALVLAQHAIKVYIIYRGDKLRAEPVNAARVAKSDKIEVITNTNITEIKGDEKGVTHVLLDKPYRAHEKLYLDGVFIAIGHIPLTEVAEDAGVEINETGYIKINRKAETNIPGFFAAGDVVDTHFKQAIIGVAEGVLGAYGAYTYVGERHICPTNTHEYEEKRGNKSVPD